MAKNKKYIVRSAATGGIITALSVICLYLSAILPTGRLFFYGIASMMIAAMVVRHSVYPAVITYISTLVLAFIIVPNKIMLIPYLLFFGYYGIVKYFIEKLNNIVLEWLLKIIIFNSAMYIMYTIIMKIMPEVMIIRLSKWIAIIVLQILFIIYDYVYSIAVRYIKETFNIKKTYV